MRDLTERSKAILADHPVNKARVARGQLPATQIWLFWPGMKPESVPDFASANGGRSAALTSGVDLLRGLAVQTGVDLVEHHRASPTTATTTTRARWRARWRRLDDHDVVFVHVEAPDEASHAGDVEGKVRAIEQVDALMVPQLLDATPWRGTRGPRHTR